MMALPINSLYSLTWGDYGTSLVSAIQLLRCHGDLVDCTLAAGGRSFPAHKIVLCAASPFLLELLKNTPCKHPVVMLAGVNANDLEALLEFVYRGEVSVDHSQLPSLLQAAHCLNIQGLAPQTVAKDDYTTQIQLHPMIPQHHVKAVIDDQEQLIATIAAPQPTATVHTQVVEDINPGTITAVQEVKDVINQFLPARKRKTRAVKKPGDANKIARTETVMTTTATENGETATISTPSGKSESANTETVITVTDTTGTPASANSSTASQTSKTNTNAQKPRSRSQSEQPATCPICFAVIRQSRNLRRHLELRHFAKPGTKKERKVATQKKSTSGTSTASTNTTTVSTSTIPTVQSVQTLHTLQTVQVKKDPDAMNSSAVTPVTLTVGQGQQLQQQQLQHQHNQQQQTTAIIDQSGNITTNQGQQQIVTQTENTDGTTSLSIAHVQTLPAGHQLTLGNINQANTFYTQ